MSPKKASKKKHVVEHTKPSFVMNLLSKCTLIVLMLFLSVNIVASQMVHPLYEGVIEGKQTALVTFFKIAKDLAAFQPVKPEMQESYMTLADEIDKDDITRQEKIRKLEGLLQKYPKSRDLLYAISLLYRDSGNPIKADEYLMKAREIDPAVGN